MSFDFNKTVCFCFLEINLIVEKTEIEGFNGVYFSISPSLM